MSWKPCRSSGIMFDKFSAKSDKHRFEYLKMLESQEYLKFENLNRLSKHLYLYWSNENKKIQTLGGKSYSLNACAQWPMIIPMLKRNMPLIYKPLQKYLAN